MQSARADSLSASRHASWLTTALRISRRHSTMPLRAVARSTPAYRRAVDEIRTKPGQWRAYNDERHCVVLAGPGSGKTKALAVKIAKLLIETIRAPRGLACITYNT